MTVELVKPYDVKHIYLEHLKHYPGINSHEKLKILKMSMFHHTIVYQRSIFCPKTTNSWKAWKLVNFYFCVLFEVFEKFEFSRLVKNCPFIWAIFGQNRDFWSESFNIWYILEPKIQEYYWILAQKFKLDDLRQNSILGQNITFDTLCISKKCLTIFTPKLTTPNFISSHLTQVLKSLYNPQLQKSLFQKLSFCPTEIFEFLRQKSYKTSMWNSRMMTNYDSNNFRAKIRNPL